MNHQHRKAQIAREKLRASAAVQAPTADRKKHLIVSNQVVNGLGATTALAGLALAGAAVLLEAPLAMGLAVGLAGIAAFSAIKKLRIIEELLPRNTQTYPAVERRQKQQSDNRALVR